MQNANHITETHPNLSQQSPKKDHYIEAFQDVTRLSFAAFGVTLFVSALAWLAQKAKQGSTGFDEALPTLLHYAQGIRGILAFFTAVLFLLCLTFLAEGSWLGKRIRIAVLVPALRIAEHMFSLALGTFLAWLVIALVGGETTLGDLARSASMLGRAVLILASLSIGCAAASVFLDHEYQKIVDSAGTFTYLIIIAAAAVLICSVFIDFFWNYKPSITVTH